MRKKNRIPEQIIENIEIMDIGAEGKSIAKHEGLVVFVSNALPGDVVDLKILKKKKNFYEGKAVKFRNLSMDRVTPICEHFGLCGGCRWQDLKYDKQLYYKEKQVVDAIQRIAKLDIGEILPILSAPEITFYRNKLEFSASNKRWLTDLDMQKPNITMNGLGFHISGMFHRILDVHKCYLQAEPSNKARLAIKKFALAHDISFHDAIHHEGQLRNVIIRTTSTGEAMVIVVFREDLPINFQLLQHLKDSFPEFTSVMYAINNKYNDSLDGIDVQLYSGKAYITDKMDDILYRIRPKSFYQTNSRQALRMYQVVKEWAAINSGDIVYDLYSGTGTIANFVARDARKVVGIEYVEQAIEDAIENSKINEIGNTVFYAGDISKVFTKELVQEQGAPDVIITDPPRGGMDKAVVEQIINVLPAKIVYVSCNPATQARDMALLGEYYRIDKIQPIDMFPQTYHVENIALLIRK